MAVMLKAPSVGAKSGCYTYVVATSYQYSPCVDPWHLPIPCYNKLCLYLGT